MPGFDDEKPVSLGPAILTTKPIHHKAPRPCGASFQLAITSQNKCSREDHGKLEACPTTRLCD